MAHDRQLISVSMDGDLFRLTVTSYGMTMPAGPRLFRAPPHPDVRFTHETLAAAEADAAKLQAYIDAEAKKRQPTKKQARQVGAD